MPATFSIESIVQNVMDRRDISAQFLGELATLYDLPGGNQTRISQALREARPFGNEHEPLRTLAEDIDAYCKSLEPVPVAFKKPALIKNLLDEFRKTKEQTFAYSVYVIEFQDDRTMFQGMQDGKCRRTSVTSDAASIKDKQTADAAVNLLEHMGHLCRHVFVRVRTTESKIARTLDDLRFRK